MDVVRVGDPPDLPLGSLDPAVLAWAEQAGRLLVSNDKETLSGHLATHRRAGRHSPGIFTIRRQTTLNQVVSFLVLAAYASESHEWQDRIEYIG